MLELAIRILFLVVFFASSTYKLKAQGCMPSRHIPPNLGTQNLSYLVGGQWELGLSYRYFHSDLYFLGTEVYDPAMENGWYPIMNNHTFNFFARYSISHRWSLILNIPLVYIEESFPHEDGIRHTISTNGVRLGDIRLSANYWLIDPIKETKGNVALGLGIKFPTGWVDLQDKYYTADGVELRDLDMALHPGDGGWGVFLEAYWVQRFGEILSLYSSGFYLINPRNMNESNQPMVPLDPKQAANPTFASVADQYNFRLGLNASVNQFVFSLGMRVDGMPVNDLIGDSDGFRRPGNVVYIEPGIVWSNIINTVNLSVPVAVHRNIRASNYDASIDLATTGGLADYLIFVGYTRRF